MLIDCGDKCRRVKISNPKIKDVDAGFELPIIVLLVAGNFFSFAIMWPYFSLCIHDCDNAPLDEPDHWLDYYCYCITIAVIENRSLQSTLRILGYPRSVSLKQDAYWKCKGHFSKPILQSFINRGNRPGSTTRFEDLVLDLAILWPGKRTTTSDTTNCEDCSDWGHRVWQQETWEPVTKGDILVH